MQKSGFAVPITGLAFMDEDHHGLMLRICALLDALVAGGGDVKSCGEALLSACDTHFWHEESAICSTSYPRRSQHLRKHAHLRTILASFQRSLEGGHQSAPLDQQLAFLKDWLLDHIVTEDQLLADYLKARPPIAAASGE